MREVEIAGHRLKERVTFHEETEVRFEEFDTPAPGWDVNIISGDGPDLALTFRKGAAFPGAPDGSEEENRLGQEIVRILPIAVRNTLARARALVGAGEI